MKRKDSPAFSVRPDPPLDPDEEAAKLAEVTGRYYVSVLDAVNELMQTAIPPLSSWEVIDRDTQEVLALARTSAVRMTDYSIREISYQLYAGHDAGESIEEIAARIENLYTEHWKSRSQTIARTELGTAALKGCQNRYERSGCVAEQEILDGDYDKECAARNGKRVPVTEEVKLNHPNCIATVAPVLLPEEEWKPPTDELGHQYKPSAEDLKKVHGNVEEAIKRFAQFQRVSEAEVRAKCEATLKGFIDNNPLSIRRGERGSLGLLTEGRMKTQFETQTSSGVLSNSARAEAEKNGLGAPLDLDPRDRPVYGYINTNYNSVGGYGRYEWQLRDSVKKRTTFTAGDSLYNFERRYVAGSPVNKYNQIEGWDTEIEALYRGDGPSGYLEIQVQRGVRVTDVRRLVIHADERELPYDEEMQKIVEKAKALGIEVVFDASSR